MRRHPITVRSYEGTLEELAKDVHSLRYDRLIIFYENAIKNLKEEAAADHGRGRKKLAFALEEAAISLQETLKSIELAWQISKPFMTDELQE